MDAPVKPGETFLEVTVEYRPRGSTSSVKVTGELSATSDDNGPIILEESLRLDTASAIFDAMKLVQSSTGNMDYTKLPDAQDLMAKLTNRMLETKFMGNKKLEDLQTDVTGQITEALSKQEWLSKWGRHYLPSLGRAHLLQQCNNFKDPGVQHYGGSLYTEIREKADDIFLKLPAPKPSRPPQRSARGSQRSYAP